jgi:hypothetical protein
VLADVEEKLQAIKVASTLKNSKGATVNLVAPLLLEFIRSSEGKRRLQRNLPQSGVAGKRPARKLSRSAEIL